MTKQIVEIKGMPYVPGVARGILQHDMNGDVADRIIVIKQSELIVRDVLPAAIVVIDGAPFSHQLIPILSRGVPTVLISSEQAARLPGGTEVVINGSSGLITQAAYTPVLPVGRRQAAACTTIDGVRIQLRVSTRDVYGARRAVSSGADAIGLVRSEFLVPSGDRLPDTQFYRREFEALCKAAAPLPVTIRLIDLASDKLPDWAAASRKITGTLGLQGVRLFSREPVHSVYLAQLDAIEDLGSRFDISLLLPYVTSREELLDWSRQVRGKLSRPVALGAMAETPSAALQIGEWLETTDFAGLGCNDLMQCFFGADRDLAELHHYLDPHAPSLYRFLQQVADSASQHLDRVQLCGVLPQLPGILPVLLGQGFRVFSVEAASLGYLKQTIAATSIQDAGKLASEVCAAENSGRVRELVYNTLLSREPG